MNCRRYRLDQVANFRDLGGYACDGGVTRYGVIFRSTALNKATEEDIAKIEHLGVRTVIDLRFPVKQKNCRTDWDRIWTISTVRLWVPQSWNSWIL